jgi:hypothetical protein
MRVCMQSRDLGLCFPNTIIYILFKLKRSYCRTHVKLYTVHIFGFKATELY